MSEHNEIERAIGEELPPLLQDQATELARLLIGIINHSTTPNQVGERIGGNASLNQAVSSLIGKEIKTAPATITFGTDNIFQDVNIGDVAQGNIVKITINLTAPASTIASAQEIVQLQVHKGYFFYSPMECVFVNAVNRREKEVEITHIWFDTDPPIHVLNPNRPLPKRLKPEEAWETWIESYQLPARAQEDPYTIVKARLSTGLVISSRRNEDVPSKGFVPGGPITVRILQLDTTTSQSEPLYTRPPNLNEMATQVDMAPGTADEYIPPNHPPTLNYLVTVAQAQITNKKLQAGSKSSTENAGRGKKRKRRKRS